MKRLITRSRSLLLVVALTVVAAMCIVSTAYAASSASAATRAPAASSARCNFVESLQTCESTDPTVAYYDTAVGDTSQCVFVFDITWGDRSSVTRTLTAPPDGNNLVAEHTYAAPGAYSITVTVTVTAGACTGTDSAHTFTLTKPSPPPPPRKPGNGGGIWSGWGTSVVQNYTGITGDFQVPTVTGKTGEVAIWDGLGGRGCDDALEQTGIEAQIVKGQAVYKAWWEVIYNNPISQPRGGGCRQKSQAANKPHFFKETVKAGDKIRVSVTYSSSPAATDGTYWLYLKDITRGWSEKVPVTAKGLTGSTSRDNAEGIVEDFNAGPLPDFGTAHLSNVRVYPSPNKNYGWTQQNPTLFNAWNPDKVNVSRISPAGDFKVTWNHS